MPMTKTEARETVLRRWRELPEDQKLTLDHASVLAAALAEEIEVTTTANSRKLIFAWLVKEFSGEPPWGNVPPEELPMTTH